ncbi:MAG: xanthine dehydrogenase family protein molybdopterin-binding subunit [Alphaproteobacteria bacterium]|nr:xanthine dehydrogenase family protein molybdopterin-binding subunit [Alphaproteobacteria bacterium]
MRVAAPAIFDRFRPSFTNAVDGPAIEGLADQAYALPVLRLEYRKQKPGVPVGFWRAVGHSQNAFVLESWIDELAQAVGQDPYAFRRRLLTARPDWLAVLDRAAAAADWRSPLPSGRGRGLAIHESFGSIVAEVAEVAVAPDGGFKVERVVVALDCGNVINPGIVAAQMESAVAYGLSAALWGEIGLAKGRVRQGNFDDYPVVRLADMPRVDTHLVLSGGEKWGGIGEPGLPPIAPAVANALYAATGKRLSRLPFAGQDLSWG